MLVVFPFLSLDRIFLFDQEACDAADRLSVRSGGDSLSAETSRDNEREIVNG